MHCVKKITDDLIWVGANDRRLSMFEGVYSVPKGVSYNSYLLLDDGSAVVEMAAASGLTLVGARELDPMAASTRGTGELIGHALSRGARRLWVGIGGSATNDAGLGALRELGVRFLG